LLVVSTGTHDVVEEVDVDLEVGEQVKTVVEIVGVSD